MQNEVVSLDRLVDEIWPGQPPPTAAKIVQNAIVRLRKALGDRIVTRPPGYLLRVEPGELDRDDFERLRARGSSREALALFRGPPLADLAYEEFASTEIGRLEELRLSTLEERIDADLAAGNDGELIGELETLVAHHPLRERLRGQLMLALYRAGRQAEGLQVYRDGRRALVDELGLEPGPKLRELERAILAQDPSLDLPQGKEPGPARRRRLWAAVPVIVALAGAAAVALLLDRGGHAVAVAPNSVALIDPATNRVNGAIPMGARPGFLAAGSGSVWVANLDDETVSRIDPIRHRVERTIPVAEPATGLAAGLGSVWVATQSGRLRRIDPAFDTTVQTIRARSYEQYGFEIDTSLDRLSPVAVGQGHVWFGHSTTVSEIDPHAGAAVGTVGVGASPAGIAVGEGAVWVADSVDNTVTRISRSGLTTTIRVGRGAGAIAVGAGRVWVVDTQDDAVVGIDPRTDSVAGTIAVGRQPVSVAVGAGSVWVANAGSGTVTRIDPNARKVVSTIRVGGSPAGVVVARGSVWVSVDPRSGRTGRSLRRVRRHESMPLPTSTRSTRRSRETAPRCNSSTRPASSSSTTRTRPLLAAADWRPRERQPCRSSPTAAVHMRSGSAMASGSRRRPTSGSRRRRLGTRSAERSG